MADAPGCDSAHYRFESYLHILYSGVEQLAARKAHNLEVDGSNPSPATKKEVKINRSFFLPC